MIPIITYHAVEDVSSPVFVSPAVFQAQMAALADQGWRTAPLTAVLDWLKNKTPLPHKSIILTFDDAYESVYTTAWPVMAAHGFTGTLFLITDYMERSNRWPGQMTSVPQRPLMSWAQVRELAAAGWEMGVHTKTHPALPLLPPDEMAREMVESQTAVRQHTGQSARIFAQPYGAANPAVDALARRHFDGAASVRMGLADAASDPFSLPRLDAYYLHPRLIPHLERPSFRRYLQLRQLLRQARRLVKSDWTAKAADAH